MHNIWAHSVNLLDIFCQNWEKYMSYLRQGSLRIGSANFQTGPLRKRPRVGLWCQTVDAQNTKKWWNRDLEIILTLAISSLSKTTNPSCSSSSWELSSSSKTSSRRVWRAQLVPSSSSPYSWISCQILVSLTPTAIRLPTTSLNFSLISLIVVDDPSMKLHPNEEGWNSVKDPGRSFQNFSLERVKKRQVGREVLTVCTPRTRDSLAPFPFNVVSVVRSRDSVILQPHSIALCSPFCEN